MAEVKMRRYELIYLIQPEADEEGRERVATRLQSVFEEFKVQLVTQEEWGKRKLAYEINKYTKAYYMYVEFVSLPNAITEMERVLRLLDDCIRYQTIRLEDGFNRIGFISASGKIPAASACATCALPISRPSAVT